jgi:hypothetical protein
MPVTACSRKGKTGRPTAGRCRCHSCGAPECRVGDGCSDAGELAIRGEDCIRAIQPLAGIVKISYEPRPRLLGRTPRRYNRRLAEA